MRIVAESHVPTAHERFDGHIAENLGKRTRGILERMLRTEAPSEKQNRAGERGVVAQR